VPVVKANKFELVINAQTARMCHANAALSSRFSAVRRRRGRSARARSRARGCGASACSCISPQTTPKDRAATRRFCRGSGPPEKVFNEFWKPSRGRLGAWRGRKVLDDHKAVDLSLQVDV
jgi:hypothetical protein